MSKNSCKRQDTIFPSIHGHSINFVTEPLDIGLISSSFLSFFLLQFVYFVIEL